MDGSRTREKRFFHITYTNLNHELKNVFECLVKNKYEVKEIP